MLIFLFDRQVQEKKLQKDSELTELSLLKKFPYFVKDNFCPVFTELVLEQAHELRHLLALHLPLLALMEFLLKSAPSTL